MAKDDAWSARWTAEKLIAHKDVSSAKAVGDNLIEMSVKDVEDTIKVATMSRAVVEAVDITGLCTDPEIEFVLNIPKGAVVQRSAFEAAQDIPVGVGGLGDLYIAINEREFRTYIDKEARFILRSLGQHSAVTKVIRENNCTYLVERRGESTVRVLAVPDYDVTAVVVRTAIEKFGRPDIIAMANPNARDTEEAAEAAERAGCRLLKWGPLLGALNH